MDYKTTRITWQSFATDLEKYPYSLQQLAEKLGVTSEYLLEKLKQGNLYDNGFGGFVIK
jgi:tape measure domain-containing protein